MFEKGVFLWSNSFTQSSMMLMSASRGLKMINLCLSFLTGHLYTFMALWSNFLFIWVTSYTNLSLTGNVATLQYLLPVLSLSISAHNLGRCIDNE